MRLVRSHKTLISAATACALVFAAHAESPQPSQPNIPPEILAKLAQRAGGNGGGEQDKEFPDFAEVSKDYEQVRTSEPSTMYTLWVRTKDGQALAELPRHFEKQEFLLAYTISAGTPFAGIQFNELYGTWKRYDDTLALIEPNYAVRTTGDKESRLGRDRIYTDRVVLTVPIVTMGPGGGPVIDMDAMLVGGATNFFGAQAHGANAKLARVEKAKAFPENVELAFSVPGADGRFVEMSYSFRVLPRDTGYKPRTADSRVGFFTTSYQDIGDPSVDDPWVRYINRWKLEKADPRLSLSPPKEPIIFYIEHTTPIRYRRWVRDGVLEWNKAFEKVGISNAIEVYQQDARTGAHMDKDPEDARYNFINWTNATIGFAIGPSRAHPETGQILDADVVMSEGFVRSYTRVWSQLIAEAALEGFGPETLAWLDERPQWDPRIRFAAPGEREQLLRQRAEDRARGLLRFGGHPAANADNALMGDDPFDGLYGRISQCNGYCAHAMHRGIDLAMFRMAPDILIELANAARDDDGDKAKKRKKLEEIEFPPGMPEELKQEILEKMAAAMEDDDDDEDDEDDSDEASDGVAKKAGEDEMLDGAPEWFVGPLIKDVIMHEVGHVIGLRHNFNASTIYTLAEVNSEEHKGLPITGSVMDYNPVNINYETGSAQGEYAMVTIGPYDSWAIEYGYAPDKDVKQILSRAGEPELTYATDEDTWGPDPRARRHDMGADPLEYCESLIGLVQHLRPQIIERIVKDGDSWAKARNAYQLLLFQHLRAVSHAANWVGGSYIYRNVKTEGDSQTPIADIDAARQRRALEMVIDNAFRDDAFGLSEELLRRMTIDKWWDGGGFGQIFTDPTYNVHDTILNIQSAALTMLMNPTTLRRMYDNEYRIAANEDAINLPELLFTVSDEVWSELDRRVDRRFTAREPMISSLRRNLQREHLERLIDLTMPGSLSGAAAKPIANLATFKMREIAGRIDEILEAADSKIDPYTLAHLSDAAHRIEKALDAVYIYNAEDIASNPVILMYGEPVENQR